MKAKVERLRVGLAAGTVLLLLVLVGTLAYGRLRRAGHDWFKGKLAQAGVGLVRESNGVTFSQSLKDKTVVTIHAAKSFQYQDGHLVLHDVVITVFGTHDGRADRIYGKDFEWDESKGIARALGETEMDLQVSAATATAQRAGAAAPAGAVDSNSVHVRTSGLVFLRKLGVAATTEPVEFRYGEMTCTAKGAEFDSNPSEVHLLADVHATGVMRGMPVTLNAVRVDFARTTNVASFTQPVLVSRDGRAQAANAALHLRGDGSVEHVEASGGVALDEGTRHLTATQMDSVLSERSLPLSARFVGSVRVADERKDRPAQGEAGELRLRFDGEGRPVAVIAVGAAHALARQAAANGVWLEREMRGDRLDATLAAAGKGRAQLQTVHATGSASMRGDSLGTAKDARAAEVTSTSVTADDLLTTFATVSAKSVRPDKLHAQGHAVLRQTGTLGEERNTSADTLDAVFAPGDKTDASERLTVASVTEDGHVVVRSHTPAKSGAKTKQDEVATGTADHAAYDGASEKLTLTGGAHLVSGGTSVAAATITLDQGTGDADARGGVVATLAGNGAPAVGTVAMQATHLAASHAVLHHATEIAEFEGTEGKPARMWQEASQVEAGSIVLDRQKQTLVARPGISGGAVHSVFAVAQDGKHGAAKRAEQSGASADVLRVESRGLDYSDAQREAVFEGPLLLQGATGDVRARHVHAFFAPAAPGAPKRTAGEAGLPTGSLERVVASGDVHLSQPGRQGTGDELTYKAADGSFTLTGTLAAPPRIVDAQQGSVTGTSLVFRPGDSTIVVSGGTAAGETKHTRARIDTKVRQ